MKCMAKGIISEETRIIYFQPKKDRENVSQRVQVGGSDVHSSSSVVGIVKPAERSNDDDIYS
jgi:hypothetical protein